MSINQAKQNFEEAKNLLNQFISDDNNWLAIETAGNMLVNAFRAGNKAISCGNGGSMCDAMHFAEELSGRFRDNRPPFPAIAISDPSYISCTANDFGYAQIFSRFVEGVGKKGDVLLAISTSGNSANVNNAIKTAKKKEMQVIGLTGKGGGEMAPLCDVEIRAPFSKYSDRVQEIHIKVVHSLIHFVENNLHSFQ